MRRAYGRVAFDHTKRLPPALLPDRLKIDTRHHAPASPMVPPIVDIEIRDIGLPTGRSMRLADRRPSRQLVFARIGVRLTQSIEKYPSFFRTPAFHEQPMQRLPNFGVHAHSPGLAIFGLGYKKRICGPIYILPIESQRFADPQSLIA